MRVLSPKGIEQCANARHTWLPIVQDHGPLHCISSSAIRCHQTLREIIGEEGTKDMLSLGILYDDMLQPQGEGLWEACGYAPIHDYFQQPGGYEFLKAYADRALDSLLEVAEARVPEAPESPEINSGVMVVCGHSMYHNAIVYEACKELGIDQDLPLYNKLAETDGFLLTKMKDGAAACRLLSELRK